jgi:hypothetical protein
MRAKAAAGGAINREDRATVAAKGSGLRQSSGERGNRAAGAGIGAQLWQPAGDWDDRPSSERIGRRFERSAVVPVNRRPVATTGPRFRRFWRDCAVFGR